MNLDDPLALLQDNDARQELKEAVCDAVLERVRREVSGEGEAGKSILGERPSRVLASGFILPKLNINGDDESSDIRIPSHGMDLALAGEAHDILRVVIKLSVYLRAMPSSEQMYARGGRLVPPARFNAAAQRLIRAQRDAARATRIPADLPRAQRIAENKKILEEIYTTLGVVIPPGAMLVDSSPQDTDDAEGHALVDQQSEFERRLRIPNSHAIQMQIPPRWVRVEVLPVEMELPLPGDAATWDKAAQTASDRLRTAIRNECATWIASPDGQAWAWRAVPPPSEAFFSPNSWDGFLSTARATPPNPATLIPNFNIAVLAQLLRDARQAGRFSARIALENLQELDNEHEFGLFGLCISIDAPEASLAPLSLERVRRSYHLDGFLSMPAIGVNCGVDEGATVSGRKKLRTTWMPRYVLPRMAARSLETQGVESTFSRLASERLEIKCLRGLPDALEAWANNLRPPLQDDADAEVQKGLFTADQQAWRAEASRIRLGVEVLERAQAAYRVDPHSQAAVPYTAWILTNKTFERRNPPSPQRSEPSWRLFQLAFVLAHIPTLASRMPQYEDVFRVEFDEGAITLLYLATGGGKTEAFFGAITYALFLDRLRGKHRGVTAMMHYPLRLLTVQQAQRLARLLAKAEVVRRAEGVTGEPFEIGFFVGGNNTPNSTAGTNGRVYEELRCIPAVGTPRAEDESARMAADATDPLDRDYQRAQLNWNKLPVCPFCDCSGTALRMFPARRQRLGIVCNSANCDWNRSFPGPHGTEPLPFLLADSDIFRRAPAILLGTIDKLALLAPNTKIEAEEMNRFVADSCASMFSVYWKRRFPAMPRGLQRYCRH